jgi:hypothetical protein
VAIDYTYKDSIEPSESNEDKKSLSYRGIRNRLDEITSKNSQESLSDKHKNKLLNFYGSFDKERRVPEGVPEISPNSYDFKKLNMGKGCSVNYNREEIGSIGDGEKLDFFATHERISGYLNEIFNRYVLIADTEVLDKLNSVKILFNEDYWQELGQHFDSSNKT